MLLTKGSIIFTLFVCSCCGFVQKRANPGFSGRQRESRLMKKLLQDYDPEVRPLVDLKNAIDVHVTFTPIRIDDLDLRSEVMKITGWITMVWTDEFLQWDPGQEDNITCLLVPRENIWIPPLGVINSMQGIFMSYDQTHCSKAQVCWWGGVRYVITNNFVLSCDVDIYFFPFDRQTCGIQVISWYHPRTQVKLSSQEKDMVRTYFEQDGEWTLLSTQVTLTFFNSSTHHPFQEVNDAFSLVTFSLTVQRRPTYYVVNVMLPCMMLCVLVLINFVLPPDSGEKVSLGVTVLLAFTVFQLLIAEIVPTSAICTPKLAIFLICIMATSTFSIVISVFVLHLHYRTICTNPPFWLRYIVLDLLARCMCMNNSHTIPVIHPEANSKECLSLATGTPSKKPSVVDTKFSDPKLIPRGDLSQPGGEDLIERAVNSDREFTCCSPNLNPDSLHTIQSGRLIQSINSLANRAASGDTRFSQPQQQEFIRAVRDVYRELRTSRHLCELEHSLENEWKTIARVVDRLLFWITFIVLLVTSLGVFVAPPSNDTLGGSS